MKTRFPSGQHIVRIILSLTVTTLLSCLYDGGEHDGRDDTPPAGSRRFALLIGVGEYQNPRVNDLSGPPNDVRRFRMLLEDKYGFDEGDIVQLVDRDATVAIFKSVFMNELVDRTTADDVVVIFFSGHGSQARDRNGDEPDEWDETILFHDSRTAGIGDMVDDELNEMLAALYEKTENVVMILDSCNSGTATRLAGTNTYVARFQPPAESEYQILDTGERGDGGAGWLPASMPGLIVFSAASDGTPALEKGGRGIFTDAMIAVLSQEIDGAMTYAQAARQIPPLVAAESYQIPSFQGRLHRAVFGSSTQTMPLVWEIRKPGPPIEMTGPPLPGIGVGAEFRIYPGNASVADLGDLGKSKATVVVDKVTGLNANVHVYSRPSYAPRLVEGDIAVLIRPSDEATKLIVRIRPEPELGGIPEARATSLRALVNEDPEASLTIELTEGPGDFELFSGNDGDLRLAGPENIVRNVYSDDKKIPRSLWLHARQKALRNLRGETGADFTDNETLQVELVPAKVQGPCSKVSQWEQQPANSEQVIPLCTSVNIKVTLASTSKRNLQIGGVVFSSDGSIFGIPADGRKILLRPGEETVLQDQGETFTGVPPLDMQDAVMIFGTQETNPVPWHLLTETAGRRSVATRDPSQTSSLFRTLDRYITPGQRGMYQETEDFVDTTWTVTAVTMRVEANARFVPLDPDSDTITTSREYTIKDFDIRPYLPDNTSTNLYRVLLVADKLAKASVEDGIGYKQHAWNQGSDAENLKLGIDCSRAIWYIFTRVGLPYNRSNQYIPTALMVTPNSLMNDEFFLVDDRSDLQIGDILVYRDDTQGDGHVVIVVDPVKRIAWGSHGWDGNAKEMNVEPDTGVEYQLIKYRKDWQRWDRRTMERKAVWRYRDFVEESQLLDGAIGVEALGDNPCSNCAP